MAKDEYLFQYKKVFTDLGEVKLCGREDTMKLIHWAYIIDKGLDYGNEATGMMNVENLKKLKQDLMGRSWGY